MLLSFVYNLFKHLKSGAGPTRSFASLTIFTLLCLTLKISSAAIETPIPEKNLDRVTLALKWKHQFQFAGYYAALEKGFYRDAGLDVIIVEAKDGLESSKSVILGEAEFGTAMSDLALLRAAGHPVVAMAAIFQHSPLVILAPKRTEIRNIHDLAGRRIALEAHAEELLAYLENEGVPASKLLIQPHSYGTSQLIEGQVDAMSAYSTDEPFMLLQAGIEYNVFSPRAGGIDFYGDVLYTTEEQIQQHPQRVSAFLDATLRGWQYAMTHQEEIVDLILTKYSQRHSREHLLFEAQKSARLMMMDVIEIGYLNPGRWQHIANTYQRMGVIPAGFSLDGFIYDRNPKPDLSRIYYSLAVSFLMILLIALISIYFYRLNRSLKQEICKRKVTESNLMASERRLNVLMSNLPGIAYRCQHDANRGMLFLSQGCRELTGYDPGDLIGDRVKAYSELIVPEDREMVDEKISRALVESRSFTAYYRIEAQDGTIKWVWDQGRSVPSPTEESAHIEGFITDISVQKRIEKEREQLIVDLQNASSEIKMLRGILPICSFCKKIRDDKGYWNQLESYLRDHTEANFSHGICPDCIKEHYPDYDQVE